MLIAPLYYAKTSAQNSADVFACARCSAEFWAPHMLALGYELAARICTVRMGNEPPPAPKAKPTGPTIFVKVARFRKLRDFSLLLAPHIVDGNDRGQRCAACVLLHDVEARRDICVACAHLFPPSRAPEEVRAREMAELMITLQFELARARVANRAPAPTDGEQTGVIVCGDWNSAPEWGYDGKVKSPGRVEACLVGSEEQRRGLAKTTAFTSSYAHRPCAYTAQDFSTLWNKPPKFEPGSCSRIWGQNHFKSAKH